MSNKTLFYNSFWRKGAIILVPAFSLLFKPVGAAFGDSEEDQRIIRLTLEYGAVVVLVLFSGLFSGLTLGLLGLDKIGLEIVIGGGSAQEAKHARKIKPIRENGNLLLCTLLFGNVAVNTILSIILAEITSGLIGGFLATGLIVIFGEILPQAICSRHALAIGAATSRLVKIIICLFYPIAKPISWFLDKALGDEIGTIHSREELMKLLQIHVTQKALDQEGAEIAVGAIKFMEKKVSDVMTPMEKAYFLQADSRLGFELVEKIFRSGYSRIPVYGKDYNDIVGILFTKDLILLDPEDETPISRVLEIFRRQEIYRVWPDDSLADVLKAFKRGHAHLAIVTQVDNSGEGDPFFVTEGIITLEDIIEEILQEEIVDETDVFEDVAMNKRVENRASFDFAQLKCLDSKNRSKLTPQEVRAISAHLSAHYPPFEISHDPNDVKGLTLEGLQNLIRFSEILDLKKPPLTGKRKGASDKYLLDDRLYARGRPDSFCTLILQGKLEIFAGRESFRSEAGLWDVIASEALVDENYTPDFSASIYSETVRVLRISRVEYEKAKLFKVPIEEDRHIRRSTIVSFESDMEEKGERSRHASSIGSRGTSTHNTDNGFDAV